VTAQPRFLAGIAHRPFELGIDPIVLAYQFYSLSVLILLLCREEVEWDRLLRENWTREISKFLESPGLRNTTQ